ncbi:hypothetical protein AAHB36_19725 [Bacillus velezensis]
MTRIFIIFHDCCHQSFFKQKKLNRLFGFISGVLTLFPFLQWRPKPLHSSCDKQQLR